MAGQESVGCLRADCGAPSSSPKLKPATPLSCLPASLLTPQVHSVPGLELLSRKQLEDSRLLGFRWTAQPLLSQGSGMAGGSGTGTTSGACCSLDGQLVLAGQSNELARLAVVADCALPAPPASVYDMRVAQAAAQAAAVAAAAAAAGHRRSLAGSGSSHGAGYPVRLEAPVAAAQQVDVPAASAAAAGGQAGSFGRFFDQAASTMTGLASTAAGTVLQVGVRGWLKLSQDCLSAGLERAWLSPSKFNAT